MYQNPVDPKTYSTLNKDRYINKHFNSKSVGKCMQLIDDYYQSAETFTALGWELYYLEMYEGRLQEIAEIIQDQYLWISEITALDYAFFRTVGQTFNGFVKEMKIIKKLSMEFVNLDFEKAPYELDEKYFTDFQIFYRGELFMGGQIKPISYKYMNTPYQKKAKENHEAQRKLYMETFQVPHTMIYYDGNRVVEYKELRNKINVILHLKTMF